jgi:hypothetical protein
LWRVRAAQQVTARQATPKDGEVIIEVMPQTGEFVDQGREVLPQLGPESSEFGRQQDDADHGDVVRCTGTRLKRPDAQHHLKDLCL